MKYDCKVTIGTTTYNANQVPTTQDDNSGGVVDRWELFVADKKVGTMAKWVNGQYVTVIHQYRSILDPLDVEIRDLVPNDEILKTFTEEQIQYVLDLYDRGNYLFADALRIKFDNRNKSVPEIIQESSTALEAVKKIKVVFNLGLKEAKELYDSFPKYQRH